MDELGWVFTLGVGDGCSPGITSWAGQGGSSTFGAAFEIGCFCFCFFGDGKAWGGSVICPVSAPASGCGVAAALDLEPCFVVHHRAWALYLP